MRPILVVTDALGATKWLLVYVRPRARGLSNACKAHGERRLSHRPRRPCDRIGRFAAVHESPHVHKGCVLSVGCETAEIEGIRDQDWVSGSSVGRLARDPERSSAMSAYRNAAIQCGGREELVVSRHLLCPNGGQMNRREFIFLGVRQPRGR